MYIDKKQMWGQFLPMVCMEEEDKKLGTVAGLHRYTKSRKANLTFSKYASSIPPLASEITAAIGELAYSYLLGIDGFIPHEGQYTTGLQDVCIFEVRTTTSWGDEERARLKVTKNAPAKQPHVLMVGSFDYMICGGYISAKTAREIVKESDPGNKNLPAHFVCGRKGLLEDPWSLSAAHEWIQGYSDPEGFLKCECPLQTPQRLGLSLESMERFIRDNNPMIWQEYLKILREGNIYHLYN